MTVSLNCLSTATAEEVLNGAREREMDGERERDGWRGGERERWRDGEREMKGWRDGERERWGERDGGMGGSVFVICAALLHFGHHFIILSMFL